MSLTRRELLSVKTPLMKFLVEARDREILKVGLVPYVTQNGTRYYLIASPNPNREEDKGKTLPFTLARGTRKGWLLQEGKSFFDDLDPAKWQTEGVDPRKPFHIQELEPLPDAALREGLEELAVYEPKTARRGKLYTKEETADARYALKSFFECGTIKYKDYPIQFFAGELAEAPPASYHTPASAEVRLVSLKQAEEMTKRGEFKPDYLERLKAIDAFIEQRQNQRQR
jgi:hypothetical protein